MNRGNDGIRKASMDAETRKWRFPKKQDVSIIPKYLFSKCLLIAEGIIVSRWWETCCISPWPVVTEYWRGHTSRGKFLLKTHHQNLITRKHPTNPNWGACCKINGFVRVRIVKNKEMPQKCSRLTEANETWQNRSERSGVGAWTRTTCFFW